MVTEEAERVVGPSRASADDVASEWDTMALLALLDWVPPLPIPFVVRFLPGAIAKADLNNYDRDTSATRLQSCFCRRWRVVTSRRPKENCLCCTHLYTLQPKKIPNCNRVPRSPRYDSKTYIMVPKREFWLQNRRFGSKTAAEKTHPSTLLPLGTTGQDETALQDDRPVACVST